MLPEFDVLVAGFPCQPFSRAGIAKKRSLGRSHGFSEPENGRLFFSLARLIEKTKPPVVLLENVRNLLYHDSGRTWANIRTRLDELGYDVHHQVLDASSWVPQRRERVFIVGFRRSVFGDKISFRFPRRPRRRPPILRDILQDRADEKYTLSEKLWAYLKAHSEAQRMRGNGFGFEIARYDRATRTLTARYGKDGAEILVPQGEQNPRRLTPREAARLMGFPDRLKIVVSDAQAYRQFGNAVVPAVAEAVMRSITAVMHEHPRWRDTATAAGRTRARADWVLRHD